MRPVIHYNAYDVSDRIDINHQEKDVNYFQDRINNKVKFYKNLHFDYDYIYLKGNENFYTFFLIGYTSKVFYEIPKYKDKDLIKDYIFKEVFEALKIKPCLDDNGNILEHFFYHEPNNRNCVDLTLDIIHNTMDYIKIRFYKSVNTGDIYFKLNGKADLKSYSDAYHYEHIEGKRVVSVEFYIDKIPYEDYIKQYTEEFIEKNDREPNPDELITSEKYYNYQNNYIERFKEKKENFYNDHRGNKNINILGDFNKNISTYIRHYSDTVIIRMYPYFDKDSIYFNKCEDIFFEEKDFVKHSCYWTYNGLSDCSPYPLYTHRYDFTKYIHKQRIFENEMPYKLIERI